MDVFDSQSDFTSATFGLSFGGDRDIFKALGWKRNLTFHDYLSEYEENGIATTIIELFPKLTWRGDDEINEPQIVDEGSETFADKANALLKRLGAWQELEKADILSRIGTHSVILIGAPGDLNIAAKRVAVKDIAHLTPYPETFATWDSNSRQKSPEDPRFGRVDSYKISLDGTLSRDGKGSSSVSPLETHWSRTIHVVDTPLFSRLKHRPILKNTYWMARCAMIVAAGASEAFWQQMAPIFAQEVSEGTEPLGDEDAKDRYSKFLKLMHQLPRLVNYTKDFKILQAASLDPVPTWKVIMQFISATTGIPVRILVGAERGELASGKDDSNLGRRIHTRRNSMALPVLRQLIGRFQSWKALPESDTWTVLWPNPIVPDAVEQAEIQQKHADSMVKVAGAGGVDMTFGLGERRAAAGFPEKPPDDFILEEIGAEPLEGEGVN